MSKRVRRCTRCKKPIGPKTRAFGFCAACRAEAQSALFPPEAGVHRIPAGEATGMPRLEEQQRGSTRRTPIPAFLHDLLDIEYNGGSGPTSRPTSEGGDA